MSWEEATRIWAELTGPDDGFYLSLQVRLVSLKLFTVQICVFIASIIIVCFVLIFQLYLAFCFDDLSL